MYAKLFASLYQGTLRGKPDEILVFTNLLAHTTREGVVDKHFRAIAEETGLTIEAVKAAIEVLESPDPESRSPEEGGARIVRIDEHRVWGWRVVNHGKYRAIKNEEDRAEQNRLAQQRYRERQNVNKVSGNAYSKQSKPRVSDGKPDKPMQRQMHKAESDADTKADIRDKARASLEAITLFCRESGLYPRDAEYLWNTWEANGWKVSGKAIKDWRATVRAWKAQGYLPSQKTPSAADVWPTPPREESEEEDLMARMMRNKAAKEAAEREAAGEPPETMEGSPKLW